MMKSLAVLLLASTASAHVPAIHPSMVERINESQGSWEAHESPRFDGKTIEHVASLCGTYTDPAMITKLPEKDLVHPEDTISAMASMAIPSEFDSRKAFSQCANVIGHIRDQAQCGSCWAFASTEAFNDRLCIASNGEFQTLLSPQDVVDCCGFWSCSSQGCNGGQPGMAWKWFKNTGVVTGGDYEDIGKGSTCIPYQYKAGANPTSFGCTKQCMEYGYTTQYKQDKHYGASYYSISGVEAMQRDIMQYGPISGAFYVYEDFPAYKSGVYVHTEGGTLGGHAIKIIGWGTENGMDYWLVNNSWNTTWGEKGLFKIRRGTDECGIESMSVNGGRVDWATAKRS